MTRLHIPQPLSPGAALAPTLDQSRYLTQVMRLKAEEKVRDQIDPPDVHLLIATVKKAAPSSVAFSTAN
ncbi:MAG: 16S rRNA (uracil(1498)-N(3))-methyltransferase, partial [Brevundimonas sp.]